MKRKKIIPVQVCKSTFLLYDKNILPQLHQEIHLHRRQFLKTVHMPEGHSGLAAEAAQFRDRGPVLAGIGRSKIHSFGEIALDRLPGTHAG